MNWREDVRLSRAAGDNPAGFDADRARIPEHSAHIIQPANELRIQCVILRDENTAVRLRFTPQLLRIFLWSEISKPFMQDNVLGGRTFYRCSGGVN